ncbi:hypothetical protein GNI_061520 [Gregarina niphandrodes]|uniref:Uncharacterized protein n=1 Tax=Gregarina niphandrodes TaxID=110365 RepID=A0A023B8B9_GRENI|nr:hypothetical protein GNI_061520 [Gregarina niphandrodes]EZG68707.1 hypothetical protein GNI_061520 [Gregarina niphandrodes]|eukprot:XP_011134551.1 hypothetical protein GNI_061520 [Gregarina niphandrodes]
MKTVGAVPRLRCTSGLVAHIVVPVSMDGKVIDVVSLNRPEEPLYSSAADLAAVWWTPVQEALFSGLELLDGMPAAAINGTSFSSYQLSGCLTKSDNCGAEEELTALLHQNVRFQQSLLSTVAEVIFSLVPGAKYLKDGNAERLLEWGQDHVAVLQVEAAQSAFYARSSDGGATYLDGTYWEGMDVPVGGRTLTIPFCGRVQDGTQEEEDQLILQIFNMEFYSEQTLDEELLREERFYGRDPFDQNHPALSTATKRLSKTLERDEDRLQTEVQQSSNRGSPKRKLVQMPV